ncbi:MAG: Flp pilus assembly protein CpaB, partial [Rhizobiales bacterium]|nr:Flp pilus assembly protein CpaB [Hyphomicrobiales bacterium]
LIALAAGGIAALLAGRSEKAPAPVQAIVAPKLDTVDVLTAKVDIAMGQIVSAQDMTWQTWPRDAAGPSFIRKQDKADALEQLAGSIARTPFVISEPIREAKLIKGNGSGFMAAILPAGKRAVSTEISPETGAGGFILPNDHVDVILTRRDREAEKRTGSDVHRAEIILSDIRVLAIDQTVQEKDGQRVVVGKTATLELAPRQAETLALSRQLGTLSLALRSLADANKGAPETVVPLSTVPRGKPRSGASKPLAEMSMDEYAAARASGRGN